MMYVKDYDKYVKGVNPNIVRKYVKSIMNPVCLDDMFLFIISSISSIIMSIAGVTYLLNKDKVMLYIMSVGVIYTTFPLLSVLRNRVVGLSVIDNNVVIGDTWGEVVVIPKKDIKYTEYCGEKQELYIFDKTEDIICKVDLSVSKRSSALSKLIDSKIKVKSMISDTYYFVRPNKTIGKSLKTFGFIVYSISIPMIIFNFVTCMIGLGIGILFYIIGFILQTYANEFSINVNGDSIVVHNGKRRVYHTRELRGTIKGSSLEVDSEDESLHICVSKYWSNSNMLQRHFKMKGLI